MKRIMTPEHFKTKPITWWPHETGEMFEGDDLVIKELDISSQRILDIGSGRGRMTFPLRDMGHELHAVEINSEFILHCLKKDTTNITFYNAEATALPFKDNSFDKIICVQTLMHLPDLTALFWEVKRVLKSGGSFIFTFPTKYSSQHFRYTL